MKHLAIMIKPVSSFCNLNCKYCFYKDVSKNREIACYPKMDYSTATKIIDQAFASEASTIDFAFQGGEPTLA